MLRHRPSSTLTWVAPETRLSPGAWFGGWLGPGARILQIWQLFHHTVATLQRVSVVQMQTVWISWLTKWHTVCFGFVATVLGTIRSRHLVTHAPLIVRLFGFRAYLRCVACVIRSPRRSTTFLSVIGNSLMN